MNTSRRSWILAAAAATLVLAGCAPGVKLATGDTVVRERLMVSADTPWNQFESAYPTGLPTWTMEGFAVDALTFYVGIKDGDVIVPTPAQPKGIPPFTFRASMTPAEIIALYQRLLTVDGSTFQLGKVQPAAFVGTDGFRFEYTLVRKSNDVKLSGFGYGAVRNKELFLIRYDAPTLAFFPRYAPKAEALMRSARVVK